MKTGFLPNQVSANFRTLDGSCVRAYLEGLGYTVVSNRDTGRNGEATTACGITVSTNGYVMVKGA
jgi:hypothetical protein